MGFKAKRLISSRLRPVLLLMGAIAIGGPAVELTRINMAPGVTEVGQGKSTTCT